MNELRKEVEILKEKRFDTAIDKTIRDDTDLRRRHTIYSRSADTNRIETAHGATFLLLNRYRFLMEESSEKGDQDVRSI
eukprot:UN04932